MPFALKIIWKTKKDEDVCPTCKALDGYTWILESGANPYPDQLIHPEYGPVYTKGIEGGSLVKERKGHTCRCRLHHEFDLSGRQTNKT